MKKLKILVLNDYAFVEGGAGRVAIDSSIKLAIENNDIVFFSAVGPVSDELKEAPFKRIVCLNQKDILSNPNKLDALIKGIHNYHATRELKKLFNEWKPDIVHIHGVSKALSWATIKTIRSFNIPIIYTLHDFGLICPNMGIYNFRKDMPCDYYKKGRGIRCLITNCDKRSYSQKLWRWIRFFYNVRILKIKNAISGYIAVSDFIYNFFKDYLPPDALFEVINNPIEYSASDLEGCSNLKKEGPVVFLYVGRLSREKGLDILLEAVKELDAKLVIIGDGELMPMAMKYFEILGKDRIDILGWQNMEIIAEQMKKSNALVLPSRVLETSGMVVMEAARFCLPSIVSEYGGQTGFVKDGFNGFYFKIGDAKSLRDVMEKFINKEDLRHRLSSGARKMLEKKGMKIDRHIESLRNFYREVIDNNRNLNK